MAFSYLVFFSCSGIQSTVDGTNPAGSRVLNVTIRCIECDVPRYQPIQLDKYYRVVSQSFLGGGGDGFSVSIIYYSAIKKSDISQPPQAMDFNLNHWPFESVLTNKFINFKRITILCLEKHVYKK